MEDLSYSSSERRFTNLGQFKAVKKSQKTYTGKLTRFVSLQWKMFKAGELLAGFRKKYCKILSKTFLFILLKLKLGKRKKNRSNNKTSPNLRTIFRKEKNADL